MYKQNDFRAAIGYSEQPSSSRHSGIKPVCTLGVYQPGGGYVLHYRTSASSDSLLRSLFDHATTARMLRVVTHLTIDLALVTSRGKPETDEYGVTACDAMKSLCLSLAGASKLEQLSISVKPEDQDSSDVDLANILWPLLLLRSDVTVKFEGITADPEETSTRKRPESIDPAFCQQIAMVRQLCNSEFDRLGLEERHWASHKIHEAEKMLYALQSPGKKVLCLDDIVNASHVWKGMQHEIDRVEAPASDE